MKWYHWLGIGVLGLLVWKKVKKSAAATPASTAEDIAKTNTKAYMRALVNARKSYGASAGPQPAGRLFSGEGYWKNVDGRTVPFTYSAEVFYALRGMNARWMDFIRIKFTPTMESLFSVGAVRGSDTLQEQVRETMQWSPILTSPVGEDLAAWNERIKFQGTDIRLTTYYD